MWGTRVPHCSELCFRWKAPVRRGYAALAISHTGVNAGEVIHRSSEFFPTVDEGVDNWLEGSGEGLRQGVPKGHATGSPGEPFRRYFHCVETTNPAAMKPKPTTMFQLRSDSTGISPLVT